MSRLTPQALNRALLARQGLLERLDGPLVEVVEAVGALQAQAWAAPPVALWSRMADFAPDELYAALERGDLLTGILHRGTLHLVSAREHPAYAVVQETSGGNDWRRTKAERTTDGDALAPAVVAFAAEEPRTTKDLEAFAEDWVADHPGAIPDEELAHQRKHGWRTLVRTSALVRVPADGRWGAKAPAAVRPAPTQPGARDAPSSEQALDAVVARHLRAFGPAGPEDVASWIGGRVPPVREALERLAPDVVELQAADGRTLYDLPDAPRPDPETAAPPRFLAAFDSILLAYDGKRRDRILPDEHRDAVYNRANLQIRPTFLVDGLVAGTWSLEAKGRKATLTLRPLRRLTKAVRGALEEEGVALVGGTRPDTTSHAVVVEA
jgi:Winged helix DNA-binding domain